MGLLDSLKSFFGVKQETAFHSNAISLNFERGEFQVVGVTFDNEDGTNRQTILRKCSDGDMIMLRRRYSKKYPNAVEVWTEFGQIGHISEYDARVIAKLMDDGKQIDARIKKLIGGTFEKPKLGCILLLKTDL